MVINNILIAATFIALIMILAGNNWRLCVAGLAILYLVSFVIILQIWPVALASVKLLAGWMGIILISASQITKSTTVYSKTTFSLAIFRLLIASLVWIVITATAGSFNEWIPIPYTNLYVGLIIFAGGLIYASINKEIFDIIIGLLMILAGFDVVYSSLEGSALVTGIFAVIIIMVSLLNSYFRIPFNEVIQ